MNKIVSQEYWLKAREDLLVAETETVRQRDTMAARRRRMPGMAVEAAYAFEGFRGKMSLGEKVFRKDGGNA